MTLLHANRPDLEHYTEPIYSWKQENQNYGMYNMNLARL